MAESSRKVSFAMPSSDDRSRLARHAATLRWAQDDPYEGTKAARSAFLARFENQVDPDRTLDPAERARRAEAAKSRYFKALRSKRSMKARKTVGGDADAAA